VYAYKAVKQDFTASDNLIGLMHKFTGMVNLVICIISEVNYKAHNISLGRQKFESLWFGKRCAIVKNPINRQGIDNAGLTKNY